MIGTLLVLSLATMLSWEAFRYITPVAIPVRLAPFLVFILAAGWTQILGTPHFFVMSAAAAGGVAVLHAITGATGIEPWKFPKRKSKPPKHLSSTELPELPPSIGRRIPQL
jgi:hypothetical protein